MQESKIIYLIRHGQTDYNLQGIIQGSKVDTDLNETGLHQSEDFYLAHKHIPFKKVYTSKLKRSQQSVASFIADGIPHEACAELNEISWGIYDGVANTGESSQYYQEITKKWAQGETHLPIGGGETPDELSARQRRFIDRILPIENENPILICMHGRAIRILLCTLMQKPLSQMDTFSHSNLCLYKLSYEEESKTFNILSANETIHLRKVLGDKS